MADFAWPDLLTALLRGEDLPAAASGWAMAEVMAGNATPVQLAGFLVALRAKGETIDELTGLADAMLAAAVPLSTSPDALDIVGTGGDRAGTVNVSTMAALVAAGAGVRIIKHGNRASSSKAGSADVLEALGVRLDQPVARVAELADEIGITFCHAQVFHPSMRHAGVTRKELGVGTAFNFLGPLTNPARVRAGAIGVADRRMAPIMAGVLAARGTSALVFRGSDGLDELAPTAPAEVWEVRGGAVVSHQLDAVTDLGLVPTTIAALRGGVAAENAAVVRRVLAGEPGPVRETVLLNAAAGLVAADAVGLPPSASLRDRLAAGLTRAARAIDSGAAEAVLRRWIAASRP